MNSNVRIIISGGGTGGHIYPAIAIANAIQAAVPEAEILFVGAEGKMEMQKVPQAGYKIEGLPIRGLQRSLSFQNLLLPFRFFQSLRKARKIIKDFRPQVAVGVGGYASGPLLYVAGSMGIPTLVQEQNSYAGLTNKWLAKRARKICVAYEQMSQFFPTNKIVFTGNPVRKDILSSSEKKEEALAFFQLQKNVPVILVIGGSLGARTINKSIQASFDRLTESRCQVLWQTGKYYFEDCRKSVEDTRITDVHVFDFISRMDLAYAAADVVISRAGALSISELCLVGKPAILVPSPNVSEDHQTKNAEALVRENAAVLVQDSQASELLVPTALNLVLDTQKSSLLSQNIQKLGKPDAANHIAREILALIKASPS